MKETFLTRTLLCLLLLFTSKLFADPNLEHSIEAGYIYNFTKFISWPEFKSPTFNLCILGDDPFGGIIDPIEKKTAFGRSIKVVRLKEEDYLAAFEPQVECHILYLGATKNPGDIIAKMNALNFNLTLIISDGEDSIDYGEMIGFVNRDGRIKLRINLDSVSHSKLKISAKLLEIAELVKGNTS